MDMASISSKLHCPWSVKSDPKSATTTTADGTAKSLRTTKTKSSFTHLLLLSLMLSPCAAFPSSSTRRASASTTRASATT